MASTYTRSIRHLLAIGRHSGYAAWANAADAARSPGPAKGLIMLSEFQTQKIRRVFTLHDLNRDGVMSRADFEEYTRRIGTARGWDADSPEYREVLSRFLAFWDGLTQATEVEATGQVTPAEWLEYWDRVLGTPGMFEQVAAPIARALLTSLDEDGDGAVSAEEYAALFSSGGFSAEEAAEAFARLDIDHDGRLSIDEVTQMTERFFRSDDPADPGNAVFGPLPEISA